MGYEQVAEFSVDTYTKERLFGMFTPYLIKYGVSWGFNQLVKDNIDGFIEELGYDVCWAIIFSDWEGNYLHRQKRKYRPASKITDVEWLSIQEKYDSRCFYCGKLVKRLTKDHIVPISQNGEDTAENIVPACLSCNRKKNVSSIEMFKEGSMVKML